MPVQAFRFAAVQGEAVHESLDDYLREITVPLHIQGLLITHGQCHHPYDS